MTLIMSYQGPDALVLLGDLMLSRDNEGGEAIEWPTRHDARFPLESRLVSGLYQKVMVVNPKLAVAWAGPMVLARNIVRAISGQITEPYTGNRILECIDRLGLSQEERDEVAFIFWGMTEWPQMEVQDFNCGETVNLANPAEKFKYAGSGRYHFFDTIGFTFKQTTGDGWAYDFGTVISRTAVAFHSEMVSDEPHWYRYGGGFEVLVPNVNGFEKIPLTFVFWTYDGNELVLVGPLFSQLYTPTGGLAFRRFMPVVPPNGQWHQHIFPVRNFFSEGAIETDPLAPIDTPCSVHYLLDKRRPGSVQFLERSGPGNSAVVWDGQRVQAQFTDAFITEVNGLLDFAGG